MLRLDQLGEILNARFLLSHVLPVKYRIATVAFEAPNVPLSVKSNQCLTLAQLLFASCTSAWITCVTTVVVCSAGNTGVGITYGDPNTAVT